MTYSKDSQYKSKTTVLSFESTSTNEITKKKGQRILVK